MNHELLCKIRDAGHLLQHVCHKASTDKGWWNDLLTREPIEPTHTVVAAKLMQCVSELAEAMEGDRKDLMDDKIPHRKMIEVELADAVIRIADLAGALGLDLGGAIAEKMHYNCHREDHKLENRLKPNGIKL